jgi:hypothetical protein
MSKNAAILTSARKDRGYGDANHAGYDGGTWDLKIKLSGNTGLL